MSNGGPATVYSACNADCRKHLQCSMSNSVYFDMKDCMGLPRFDIQNDPITTTMEFLSDPWVEKKPARKAAKY